MLRYLRLPPFPDAPLQRTRYPVVLIHGFGSLGTVGKPGLLHQQARYLRERGTLAYAPNVTPYDTVDVRCGEWMDRLERIINETEAEKLSLIGYSAGGLDARNLVSSCGMGDRVAAVVTINTPHRGSPLAAWTLEKRDPLRQGAIRAMDLAGRIFYDLAEPRVEAGVRELTPDHLENHFNPANPDVDGVEYLSWAGAAGKGTETRISPLLVFQNRTLYGLAGVNDGMVPVDSAKWGDFQDIVPSDHLRMAGVVPGSRSFSDELFLDIIRELIRRGH